MKVLCFAAAAVAISACTPSQLSGRLIRRGPGPATAPSRAALLAAGTRADDARVAAFAGSDETGLTAAFAGEALAQLRAAVGHLRLLRQRVERRLDGRVLVHWSVLGGAPEGVLQISGWSRLVDSQRVAAWSRFLEQWEFRIAWNGSWAVVYATDLPPAAWWR